MTVYELIQELSNYNADTEVRFKVSAEFDTDVEAEFDREDENDIQEVTVTAEFDDYVDFEDVSEYERDRYRPCCIEINLEYQEVSQ